MLDNSKSTRKKREQGKGIKNERWRFTDWDRAVRTGLNEKVTLNSLQLTQNPLSLQPVSQVVCYFTFFIFMLLFLLLHCWFWKRSISSKMFHIKKKALQHKHSSLLTSKTFLHTHKSKLDNMREQEGSSAHTHF